MRGIGHSPTLLLLLVILSMISLQPSITSGEYREESIGYIILEDTSYNTTYTWSDSSERTGNIGVAKYSWSMNAYIVAWVNITDTNYDEGPLYVYIRNSTGYEQYIVVEESSDVKGVDIVVDGVRSFAIGYTMYGNNLDTYVALIYWNYTENRYDVKKIPLGTTSSYEEYVAGDYVFGEYLFVYYKEGYLYGVVINEDGDTVTTLDIDSTGLSYNDYRLGYIVVGGYNVWYIFYTKSDNKIHHAIVIRKTHTVIMVLKAIPGKLYNAHGGVWCKDKLIIPYIDPDGKPSIAIYDDLTLGTSVVTYTLTNSGAFPLVVEGNRYVLVVWKDTSSDGRGNIYGRLIFPFNNSISDIIDIGRDVDNNYPDHHVFAAFNYKDDVFVVAWSSRRSGDPDNRVYVTTISESGDLGDLAKIDIPTLTGPFYPHGVATGSDGRVYVATKYYPAEDNSDAYLVYGDLDDDIPLPGKYPIVSYELAIYSTPDNGLDALKAIIDLVSSAKRNISIAVYNLGQPGLNTGADLYVAAPITEALIKASYRIGRENIYIIVDDRNRINYDTEYLKLYGINIYFDDQIDKYMHHKDIIIDNEYIVLSTANFFRYSFYSDRNLIVIIHNTDIAKRFTEEHKEMINGIYHGGPPTKDPGFETYINGTLSRVWVYFSPDDFPEQANTLLDLIENATRSVYIGMYHFTNDTFASVLINAMNNGIDVKAIFEAGSYWSDPDIHDYDTLVDNGVLATLDKDNNDPDNNEWYPYFHVKMMVIDHRIVYIGSAQITANGFKYNDEYLVIINHTGIARAFEEFFYKYWSSYTSKIVVKAQYTNNTPVAGVRLEINETYQSTIYSRINYTDSNGEAILYLVYPYENTAISNTYTIRAEYRGLRANNTITITTGSEISLIFYIVEPEIQISGPTTLGINETGTYTVTLVDTYNGLPVDIDTTVDLYIDGIYNKSIALTSGIGIFTIRLSALGKHRLELYFNGDSTDTMLVYSSNTSFTLNVVKNSTKILIYKPEVIDENESFVITLKLIDGDGKPVTSETLDLYVNKSGTVIYHLQGTTNSSGMVDIVVPGLYGGSYILEAIYNGSSVYNATSNATDLIVRSGTHIMLISPSNVTEDTIFYVYARITTTITSTPLAGIVLSLDIPGTSIHLSNVTNSTGWALFRVSIVDPGTYVINVSYDGSTLYMPSSTNTSIDVAPLITNVSTRLIVSGPISGRVYELLTYSVSLVDADTDNIINIDTTVVVYVNGSLYSTITLTSGTGSFNVKVGKAGLLNITLIYDGEIRGFTRYLQSNTTVIVSISTRSTILEIYLPDTIHVWDNVEIRVKLLDVNTTPIPGETILLSINGTSVSVITGSNGEATYIYKPDKLGSLTIEAYYNGHPGVYSGSSASIGRNVVVRPPPNINAQVKYEELNATHIILNISGTVIDSLNGSRLDGIVMIFVDKGGGWINVANVSVVNGVFTFNGVVDPVTVRITYLPPPSARGYYSETPSRTYTLLALLPAPESSYTPIILLVALLAIIYLYRRVKKR